MLLVTVYSIYMCVCVLFMILFVISVIVCFQSLKSEMFHVGLLDCMALVLWDILFGRE